MAVRNGARIDYHRWRQSQRENQYPHFAGALVIFDVKFSSLDIPYSDFQVVPTSALNTCRFVIANNCIIVKLRCSCVSVRSPFLLRLR